MHLLIASSWLDPIVNGLWFVVADIINKPINNLGISMIVLAAVIRLAFWPLNTAQFKAMMKMQQVAPAIKALQAKYKSDPKKLNEATMAFYKANNVNPLTGCWPMLAQYPVIISVYWVVLSHKELFQNQDFLWIGSAFSQHSPAIFGTPILAASLAHVDIPLIVLYGLSMYASVRYASMPATDPQQAQTQKLMAVVSPLMLAFFGWKYQWPSAMVLYWFFYNVFTMAQQFYMLRRYNEPLSFIDSEHVLTDDVPAPAAATNGKNGKNGSNRAALGNGATAKPVANGSKKKNKKGA